MFGHPEVYILILPAMGIVSEVLPTFARKPLFGYPVVIYSGILIAFLGFGVWSHHMFAVGLGPLADSFFALSTMLISIPTGVKIFNWIATLWGGRLEFRTPMLFAIGFIAMFIIGGLSGFMHASPPSDLQQTDTYFVVAHLHYVLFGGSVMAIFAGIYYWFPKITGRRLDERLGKIHFWTNLVALNVTFFPMHFAGLLGMPRRIYTYPHGLGFDAMNMASTIGALGIAVGVLAFVWNLIASWRHGAPAGDDPWGGATLEWAIPSPPPEHNFASIPQVHSRDPLWSRDADAIRREANTVRGPIHMPRGSFWPLVAALGITLLLGGMVYGWWSGIPGLAILLLGVYSWAFQRTGEEG
jgi:cytochrome c oxidase subunit 1